MAKQSGYKKVKKEFVEDEKLEELVNKVIEEKFDYLRSVNIKVLFVAPYISKTCVARCIKPSKELAYFGRMDYILEFSKEVWDKIPEDVRKVVVEHELLHCKVVEKESGTCYELNDHTVKDFYNIIKVHGIDWFTNLKTMTSSIFDLEPSEQDKIKL